VWQSAVLALRKMTFAPALDGLVRTFNTHNDSFVREAAMKSIAMVGTDEACEFLLDVIRNHGGTLSQTARKLLEQHAQERMMSALTRHRRSEPSPDLKAFLDRLYDRVRSERSVSI
jgi:HEAT repeat protein